MARVEWLEDHGKPHALRGVNGVVDGAHDVAAGHGQADVPQHALGLVLVLCDVDGDRAGTVGDGCLNAPQVAAESELHQRVGVESSDRDAAPPRLLDDRPGGWPETYGFVQSLEIGRDRVA